MGTLKNEYKSFLDDIEKNIKDKEDLEYIKTRFSSFLDTILNQMDKIMDYKEEEILKIKEDQAKLTSQVEQIQNVVNNIEKDIYSEDGFDFEIICPYCNHEFIIDLDEEKSEITCPECQNTIELDWTGDLEEDTNHHPGGCSGGCKGCNSCDNEEDDM